MTFNQATKILAGINSGSRSAARDTIQSEVVKRSKRGEGEGKSGIRYWIFNQGWTGKDSIQEVVAAWDNNGQYN